jgi:hypothetical protein
MKCKCSEQQGIIMGNESSKPDRIIVNNIPSNSENKQMSSLNLSVEEIIKEVSIVVLIVFGEY